MTKTSILFFYENFFPAYKAGGPVQSLNNLSGMLADDLEVYVLCNAYEIDGTLLTAIEPDKWNKVLGVNVYYLSRSQKTVKNIKSIILNIKPNVFYINGIFSLKLSILPLVLWHTHLKHLVRLVIAPRGMLQQGALKIKSLKKNIFLMIFKMFRLQNGVVWHATDPQEADDIKVLFGNAANVQVISNIPKKPVAQIRHLDKVENSLKLIFLSLITEKKNVMFALKCIYDLDLPVCFDIYGPVKDVDYWRRCQEFIRSMPEYIKVRYMGDVVPEKVQDTFTSYHALLLPTLGENFGHAIYECLSVGRPVIVSDKTPWRNLELKECGYDLQLSEELFKNAIHTIYKMDNTGYQRLCEGAMLLAKEFFSEQDLKPQYLQLFNS